MNKLFTYLLGNKVLQNILVSLAFIVWFRLMMNGAGGFSSIEQFGLIFILVFPAIFLSVLNNYFVIPYIQQRKILQASLIYILIIGLGSGLFTYFAEYIHRVFCMFTVCELTIDEILVSSLQILSLSVLVSLLALALRITRDYLMDQRAKKERELKLLRSQLNPQFLLDTLNKFSHMASIPSEHLPQLMLSLSTLLRYTLYESKETYVSLAREFEALKNYINLKRTYFPIEIEVSKTGELDAQQIAPMTLISLLDNTFAQVSAPKFAANKLTIALAVESSALEFCCKYSGGSVSQTLNLQPIKDRMDLQYLNQYELDTNLQQGTFLSLRLGL
ncbi:MAG: histidine kinase [Bacteroidota bacterium]